MRLPPMALALSLALLPLAALGQGAPRQATPQPPPAREREPTIANQSGLTLRELYAAPPGAADFGPDLLGADTVPDRGNFRARIAGTACDLEFRAVFQDGSEERRRQNICQNRRVQFGDPAIPLREGVVRNETDTTILQLFAAPPGTAGRGPDRLGENVVDAGREFRFRLGRTRDCVFDVVAVFEDGEEDARRGVNLCREPRLVFGDPNAPRREARIDNTSDRTMREFYASTRAPGAWGPDRLGADLLPAGQGFTLRVRGQGCLWDLRAVYEDSAEEVKRGVDLCTTRQLAFDGSGAPRPPERRLTLVNRHGAMVQEVYISGSSEEDWGPDRLGDEVLPRGARREVSARLRDCEADLRIVFEERRAAEERAQINLCEVGTIVLRPGWTLAERLDEGETPDAGPRPGSVRLRNGGAVPIAELYADAPGAPRGPDRLGRTVLGAGETLDFAPPEGIPCRADLTAVFRDGREVTLPATDLCAGVEVVVQ
ncbi:hypothetical protein [Neoroseomonas oryzicola]|uniref:Uncharacterized protein n=1 Tax=Neoroseomonas oryzicola TaxID=535904 RepID=A0A9X9WPT6_9PROT|nr:hypothetical protein [Neoroseomonas oryzicola]MBR0662346.1 hypothetical protein [Neoroseomonas oryzicola]NKE19248.1 hypothetical protein [Neoroseomonas oryzicola]